MSLIECIRGGWQFVLPPRPPPNELRGLRLVLRQLWVTPLYTIRLPAAPPAEWASRLRVHELPARFVWLLVSCVRGCGGQAAGFSRPAVAFACLDVRRTDAI